MTKEEILSGLDQFILCAMRLTNSLSMAVQTIPGDETSRKLRHVQDSVHRAHAEIERARSQIDEIGDWG
jgi:hypothetical protein